MHGEIKVGKWRPFTARQVLSTRGFVWAATAGRFPLRITGFDRCSSGSGEMRWRLMGVVPVMSAGDDDPYRSAAGRLAGEMMLLPGALISEHVRWTGCTDADGDGDHRCTAAVTTGPFIHEVTVGIDDNGALTSVVLPRWGNPDGEAHREHLFGVRMGGDQLMGGYRIPRTMRAGWWFGTPRWAEGEFFHATIDEAEFF